MGSYITATHYFGATSMGNFWSTFVAADVAADFAQIRSDGFTHIILLVPWAPFQPRIMEWNLDVVYRARLDFLLRSARSANLKVILRLGYLWDVCPLRYPTYNRIKDLPTSNALLKAWSAYFSLLWSELATRPVVDFAFVSWEDWYWPIYKRIPTRPEDQRLQYAKDSGFQDYLKLKYEIPDLRCRFELQAKDWSDIAIPTATDKMLSEYAAFFDTVLSDRLFAAALAGFPSLSFEFRIDDEWLPAHGAPNIDFYSWTTQRQTNGRQVTYYHPHVGKAETSTHSAEHAATQLQKVVNRFSINERRKPKLFLDQFNFYTKNPEFPWFSAISAAEVERFISLSEPILSRNTSGYGVWGYRDWINDKLFNGTFELGLDGWSHSNVELTDTLKGVRPLLVAGSRLEQKIIEGGLRDATVLIEGICQTDGVSEILLSGDNSIKIEINTGRFKQLIPAGAPAVGSTGIYTTSGRVVLHRFAIYTHVLSSGLYQLDLGERPAVRALRRLNKSLSEEPSVEELQ